MGVVEITEVLDRRRHARVHGIKGLGHDSSSYKTRRVALFNTKLVGCKHLHMGLTFQNISGKTRSADDTLTTYNVKEWCRTRHENRKPFQLKEGMENAMTDSIFFR